jgi:16S rRNA (uracil1498-N3)-methyltransferase
MRVLVTAGDLAAGRAEITGDDHHHLFRVRRLAPGAQLLVFDGEGGEAEAVVEAVEATRAILRLGAPRREPQPALHVTVIQALVKGERMDWCVQKLVEVGVDRIVVVATERAVVRLDAARAITRRDRLSAIAREAARQARRAAIPAVDLVRFDDALGIAADLRIVCHPVAARPLRALLATPAATAALLIGPEGGLAPGEVDRATAAGFVPASLGPTILRAETAGVAAVAALRIARE